jgi:hypothetical protein
MLRLLLVALSLLLCAQSPAVVFGQQCDRSMTVYGCDADCDNEGIKDPRFCIDYFCNVPSNLVETMSFRVFPNACFSTPGKKVAKGRFISVTFEAILTEVRLCVDGAGCLVDTTLYNGWSVIRDETKNSVRIECTSTGGCRYASVAITLSKEGATVGKVTIVNGHNGELWAVGLSCECSGDCVSEKICGGRVPTMSDDSRGNSVSISKFTSLTWDPNCRASHCKRSI